MAEMKITPIPKKSTDSIRDYLDYFTRVQTVNGWSDEQAAIILQASLEVGTKDLDGLSTVALKSFRAIKDELAPSEEKYREASVQEFFSLKKKDNELVDDFQRRVKQCVEDCYPEFTAANKQQLSRDAFVNGLSLSVKKTVLSLKSTKLHEAVGVAKMSEAANKAFPVGTSVSSKQQKAEKSTKEITCYKCQGKGHYSTKCPNSGQQKTFSVKNEPVESVEEVMSGRPKVEVHVNGCLEDCLMDTGAAASILPSRRFKADEESSSKLFTASGETLRNVGLKKCCIDVGDWQVMHDFYVADVRTTILGCDFLRKHGLELQVKPDGQTKLYRFQDSMEKSKSEVQEVLVKVDELEEVDEGEDLHFIALVEEQVDQIMDVNQKRGVLLAQSEFLEITRGIGQTHLIRHEIDTGNAKPICTMPYRLPVNLVPKARKNIQEMKKNGLIEPSTGEWCNPLVLVRKKNGDVRVAVDFRKVNEVAKKDAFPMPRVDNVLDSLAGSRVFSTLDCASGYHQIMLKDSDKEKTAFRFDGELLQFRVMPFGLSSAPQTFVRLMKKVLHGVSNAACYIDDICVHSKTEEEHVEHLRGVFNALKKAGLTLNMDKCEFFKKEVEFLGFTVKEGRVEPTEKKVTAIKDFPRPKNEKELKRFLGLSGYYRSLVPNYASIAVPLYRLLKKEQVFLWDGDHQKAFDMIKNVLAEDAARFVPDLNKEFIVKTDASEKGIGAMLVQETSEGTRRVVEYASKKFSEAEKRYPVIEQEAAGIMFAVDRWRHFLLGKKFRLETDHRPLVWLRTKRDCSGKLGRWALRLEEYEYYVVHVPGKDHEDVDALSRVEIAVVTRNKKMLEELQNDKELLKEMEQTKDKFVKENDHWFYVESSGKKRICLSKSHRDDIWKRFHDNLGHVGPEKVLGLVKERFYWPKMYEDLKARASNCLACAKGKDFLPVPRRSKIVTTGAAELKPFEKVAIDVLIIPNSEEGYKYVLVLMDCFTKWIEAKPVEKLGGDVLIKWMNHDILSRHSHPKEIILDRGSDMESKVFKKYCEDKQIKLRFTSAYHHQANPVERVNRSLWNLLRVGEDNPRTWTVRKLIQAVWSYRVTNHSAIGVSPFEALYGRKPTMSVDLEYQVEMSPLDRNQIEDKMKVQLKLSEKRSEEEYNKRYKTCDKDFESGQRVLLRSTTRRNKFEDLWIGPFELEEKVNHVTWKLRGKDGSTRLVHENLLKIAPKEAEGKDLEMLRSRGRPGNIN